MTTDLEQDMRGDRRTDRRRTPSMCQTCKDALTRTSFLKEDQAPFSTVRVERVDRLYCAGCETTDRRSAHGNRRRRDPVIDKVHALKRTVDQLLAMAHEAERAIRKLDKDLPTLGDRVAALPGAINAVEERVRILEEGRPSIDGPAEETPGAPSSAAANFREACARLIESGANVETDDPVEFVRSVTGLGDNEIRKHVVHFRLLLDRAAAGLGVGPVADQPLDIARTVRARLDSLPSSHVLAGHYRAINTLAQSCSPAVARHRLARTEALYVIFTSAELEDDPDMAQGLYETGYEWLAT